MLLWDSWRTPCALDNTVLVVSLRRWPRSMPLDAENPSVITGAKVVWKVAEKLSSFAILCKGLALIL